MKKILITGANSYIGTSVVNIDKQNVPESYKRGRARRNENVYTRES